MWNAEAGWLKRETEPSVFHICLNDIVVESDMVILFFSKREQRNPCCGYETFAAGSDSSGADRVQRGDNLKENTSSKRL
jgi:hypothetical protein